MLWGRLSCKSQRAEPNRGEPVALCAACARLHNGIIDYLFTSHNNSAVYSIIGAFQSPTPTRRSPSSSALFEPPPPPPITGAPWSIPRAGGAGQRLSTLAGGGQRSPADAGREFSVRDRRGDGDFPVKLHGTSARRSDLGKAAGWRGGAGEILHRFEARPSRGTKWGAAGKRQPDAWGWAGRERRALAIPGDRT